MRLKPLSLIIALVVSLCVLAVAFVAVSYFRYTSEGAVRAYIEDHAQDVAVACLDPADPASGFYHNADERFPLASTFKVVLLAGYAEAVAAGDLDPLERVPVSELEAYYLPGTDGGAHPQFLSSLGESPETVSLRDAVDGMMIYSSNAAADYIAARLSSVDFGDLYRRLGLTHTDLPFSYLGLYLFMANHETGHYAQEDISLDEARREQGRLEELFVQDAAWRAAELEFLGNQANFASIEVQKEVVNGYGMSGSARDMAAVMAAAYGPDSQISAEAQEVMRYHLEWPMRLNPENAGEFEVLAAKSGAWPGVLTSTWFGEPASGGAGRVLSVLYRDMPDDFWSAWLVGFSHQTLEIRALSESDCSLYSEFME